MSSVTEDQHKLLTRLLDECDRGGFNDRCRDRLAAGTLTYAEAQAAARYLLNGPRFPRPDITQIPNGLYATGTRTDPQFWKVTQGRKAGVVFLDEILRTGEKRSVRNAGERTRVLTAIARDWQAAGLLYSQCTSECAAGCGNTLRDPVSVATGYGPDCRERLGVPARKPATEPLDDARQLDAAQR